MPPSSRWRANGLVTLLTDFGTADTYVGVMKGVLYRDAPELRSVIDLTHEVPPQDVHVAAFFLEGAFAHFPAGTTHVVVVDPEVGTERSLLLMESRDQVVVAPDNGVIAPLVEADPAATVRAADPERLPRLGASATFHGRDRIAPLAAKLASGSAPSTFGDPFADYRRLALNEAVREDDGSFTARVVVVDRFGNLITNLRRSQLVVGDELPDFAAWRCEAAGERIGFVRTYADAGPLELVCLVDSYDRIEVAQCNGRASDMLDLGRGAEVRVLPVSPTRDEAES